MIKIYQYGEVPNSEIFARRDTAYNVQDVVAEIIENVVRKGDAALLDYTEKEFLGILQQAADNIRAYHEKQVRGSYIMSEQEGVLLGMKVTPIEKVGLYVPNGTAAYPSTVLMDAMPAKIAGCRELIMVTPPSADGKVDPGILAAAKVAGIDRVFKVGGAQAVAALAYGTESPALPLHSSVRDLFDFYERSIGSLPDGDEAGGDKHADVQHQWERLLDEPLEPGELTSTAPLLSTTWNQSPYYNLFAPTDNGEQCPTGCVATAMAQVMKYWNHPQRGNGHHSYYSHGTRQADFGATAYGCTTAAWPWR